MVSRREVLTGGIVGSLAAAPEAVAEQLSSSDREALDRIRTAISSTSGELVRVLEGPSLAHGPVSKLRLLMDAHLKSAQKFPDFIDVGLAIFWDMYDWHVRHQQQLIITRQADGRYAMQFMFTMLMLRQEQDPRHIGIPYDKA